MCIYYLILRIENILISQQVHGQRPFHKQEINRYILFIIKKINNK